MEPVAIPITDIMPAFLPNAILLLSIKMVSLPGVRFNNTAAIKKAS
jgi:hypothetical protein